ncbi:hypothetical protein LTR66_013707 [Elasticomyces elasticus]|nr:hypothetical protein LTR66_013707 [Elasticomyces elasticus]
MSSAPHVLLLGGHGRVALKAIPLMLARSWSVTSVVRNKDHISELKALGEGKPGKNEILVASLDDVTSPADAEKVLDQVDPDIVFWSAGAGGKGGPERTKAIDEVAAKHYITASLARDKVKKFLMVSYIASRKGTPAWWTKEDVKTAEYVNTKVLPAYAAAKIEADEHYAALAKKRTDRDPAFQAINLRPGTLKDHESSGKVMLGKTPARGDVSRESVAEVAVALLARDDTSGWFDLLDGDESIDQAVDRCAKEGWDGIVGEDLERIYAKN